MQNIKQKITLAPLIHKGNTWIAIQFPHLPALQQAVRKTREIKWSQSNKCWYLPFKKIYYDELLKNIEPFAEIDNRALKQYKTRKVNAGVSSKPQLLLPAIAHYLKSTAAVYPVNAHIIPAMQQMLILKAYSALTIRTYLSEMSQFLHILKALRRIPCR